MPLLTRKSAPPRKKAKRQFGASEVLARLDPEVLDTFDPRQAMLLEDAIRAALPRRSPKLLDLRFRFPPVPSSYFWVLQAGWDHGRVPLNHNIQWLTRVLNFLAGIAVVLCLAFACVFFLYIAKNLLGLDFFPGQSFFHD